MYIRPSRLCSSAATDPTLPWHGYLDPIQWSDSCFKLDNYVIDHADHDGDGLGVYIYDDFQGHNNCFCFDHLKSGHFLAFLIEVCFDHLKSGHKKVDISDHSERSVSFNNLINAKKKAPNR